MRTRCCCTDRDWNATASAAVESVHARDLRMVEPAEIRESVAPAEAIEPRVRSTRSDGEPR